jgi:predicted dehydrogenase
MVEGKKTKVRLGVIGCGGMGQGHIRYIKELSDIAELTAVADVDKPTLEKIVAQEGGNVAAFTDYNELLDSGLVDAVVIATPHYLHPVIGIKAFEKGLHVLSEKPIAVSVSDADKFISAAEKSKKVFAVMYQHRTLPAVRAAREIIKRGVIGDIKRTLMVDVHYRCDAYYMSAGWRATWKGEGCGVLINQAPHGIDLFMLLGGVPKSVTGKVRTRMHNIETEDEACAFLEYENGAWGYYYTTTCEVPVPHGMRIEICGDKGKMVYTDGTLKVYTFTPSISEHNLSSKEMWSAPSAKEEALELPAANIGHKEIIRNFCAAILFGEELIAPGKEGIWSVEFINAVNLSGRRGGNKPVEIPVPRDDYDALLEELKSSSKEKVVEVEQRITDTRFL